MVNNICLSKEHCYNCLFYRPVFEYRNGFVSKVMCIFKISEYTHNDLLATYPNTANAILAIFKGTPLDLDHKASRCTGCCTNCKSYANDRYGLCFRLVDNLRCLFKYQYIPYYIKEE